MTLAESQAQIKVFSPFYEWPVYIFDVPAQIPNPTINHWVVFCLNGKLGLKDLAPLNIMTQASPDVITLCHPIFGTPDIMKQEGVEWEEGEEFIGF